MRNLKIFYFAIAALLFIGCSNYMDTTLLHDPIYPASGDDVTYSLGISSENGISNVVLFEKVSTVDAAGVIAPGDEVQISEWNPEGEPDTFSAEFTRAAGYGNNKLVEYRLQVTNGSGKVRNHNVTFATRPYPVPDQPAPVYVQGNVDDVFDIVLIPDTDITDMDTFRTYCRGMVQNSINREPTMHLLCRAFNFYINPLTGTATDYDSDDFHQFPTNAVNLNFAEAKVLMHQNELRDYEIWGIFSTEMNRPQTLIHEGGHLMFDLADEYSNGVHWEEEALPNNWSTLSEAQAAASGRHKTIADAVQMGTSGWYKLCNGTCPMISGSLELFHYDGPCSDRVIYAILDNALD